MRALLAAVSLLAASPALGGEPNEVTLTVGEARTLGPGHSPICDDPTVATLSAEGAGVLRGHKPGKTLCSLQGLGGRIVFTVTVVPPEKPADSGRNDGARGSLAPR